MCHLQFKSALVAAVAAVGFASIASAADLPVQALPIAADARDSTVGPGAHLGAGGGYGMWNCRHNTVYSGATVIAPKTTAGGRGWFGTVQGGCDYQFAPNWVVGAFADYSFSSIKGTPTVLWLSR